MDKIMDKFTIKGEWFFEYSDGSIEGPFSNFITTAGLGQTAEILKGLASPFLVIGDDTAPGETITELFRKAVSVVTCDGPMVRFRTQLLASECNGDHQKAAIYYGASSSPGTGTMYNLLVKPWSKASNTTLTIESRITIGRVV